MTLNDLTDIFELMGYGVIIGGLIAVCSFFLGYTIYFLFDLVNKYS